MRVPQERACEERGGVFEAQEVGWGWRVRWKGEYSRQETDTNHTSLSNFRTWPPFK